MTGVAKFNDRLEGWGVAGSDIRVGLDVSDKSCRWAAVDLASGEVREGRLVTTREGVEESFRSTARYVVVLEAGTHAPWLARQLNELGHRGVVVDAKVLTQGGGRRRRKNDQRDARGLMEVAMDVGRPRVKELWQRPEEYQEDLSLMRMRDAMVRARTLLATATRGAVKQFGERVEAHSVESLAKCAREELSAKVQVLVEPALAQIEQTTKAIGQYDELVEAYLLRRPESARLRQVRAVGPVTTGVFMVVVGDPTRFKRSRDVAAYLGLAPGQNQSGEDDPQLRISKAGDELARRTLIQCAHLMMSRRGEDSALRRWALKLAGDGTNKTRKKKAAVALARKLATLLHRLWLNGEKYDPLRGLTQEEEGAVAA
jgi:transposase